MWAYLVLDLTRWPHLGELGSLCLPGVCKRPSQGRATLRMPSGLARLSFHFVGGREKALRDQHCSWGGLWTGSAVFLINFILPCHYPNAGPWSPHRAFLWWRFSGLSATGCSVSFFSAPTWVSLFLFSVFYPCFLFSICMGHIWYFSHCFKNVAFSPLLAPSSYLWHYSCHVQLHLNTKYFGSTCPHFDYV